MSNEMSLEERLRRERQRLSTTAGSITQFSWVGIKQKKKTKINKLHDMDKNDDNSQWKDQEILRLLIPSRGSLYIQDGIALENEESSDDNDHDTEDNDKDSEDSDITCICVHDKSTTGMTAMDAQLSPDGTMVAWTSDGDIYVQACRADAPIIRLTFGATQSENCAISHGVADFVAQEEMDRYRGFWWHPDSCGILFTRNDESNVPLYRILHHHYVPHYQTTPGTPDSSTHDNSAHGSSGNNNNNSNNLVAGIEIMNSSMFEDHRYPFAGKSNPVVLLGFVKIDRESVLDTNMIVMRPARLPMHHLEARDSMDEDESHKARTDDVTADDPMQLSTAQDIASANWSRCQWFDSPREASEYLARVHWLPDGCLVIQWQNRLQNCTVLQRLDVLKDTNSVDRDTPGSASLGRTLLIERSDVWINLHHMFHVLPRPIHPDECCIECSSSVSTKSPPMPHEFPPGSFSFLFASERTGFQHLYLYTYCPGINGEQAVLLKPITKGRWIVESILGVDLGKDVIYFTGTYESALQRHLYALPLLGKSNKHEWRSGAAAVAVSNKGEDTLKTASSPGFEATAMSTLQINATNSPHNGVRRGLSKVMHALSGKGSSGRVFSTPTKGGNRTVLQSTEIPLNRRTNDPNSPTKLTIERGMHSIVMDDDCRYFVDTSSDLDRPTTVKIYELPTEDHMSLKLVMTLFDASMDDGSIAAIRASFQNYKSPSDISNHLPPPDLLSFPTSDGTETLHAAVYKPDRNVHGPGPYPLVCAVYGGPHVQRVNRSWSQTADLRAQRLRGLGFCVLKCDNRGSSRRGLAFESCISRRLGRLEVLDQVAAVRQLVVRGLADPTRVGIYGWSYGGYLAAMCLCRAPDVFHVAVAGAPVTSWDGYDTHYTERYMGLPSDNASGYREAAVFDHVPNMRGKLMIVHGLIDENVHFRHTTRLINKLIAAGKEYDLLIFPEERHSPRRLRDRIYMEQRITDYFLRHLVENRHTPTAFDLMTPSMSEQRGGKGVRMMAGHL
jgi:dienelactone hydrolase